MVAQIVALSERATQEDLNQFNGLDFYCRDLEARSSIQLSYGRVVLAFANPAFVLCYCFFIMRFLLTNIRT